MSIRSDLYIAIKNRYISEMTEAKAVLEIYFNNPVGIGEHSQILEEMNKQLEKISSANGKLQQLHASFRRYEEVSSTPEKKSK